jgi:hypothetical protein
MATQYVHPNAQSRNARTFTSAGQPVVGHALFTFPGGAVTGDTVKMTQIPKGAKVMNCFMVAGDLDTGAGITLSLGDSGSPTRYFNASNIAQAGGVAELPVGSAVKGYTYANDDVLLLTVTAGAATGVSGPVEVFLEYYCTLT